MPACRGAFLLCLVLCAALGLARADVCYQANQEVNIRSSPSIASNAIGSLQSGTQIRTSGASPQTETLNWVWATVLFGSAQGQQGWVNQDAFFPSGCPGGNSGGSRCFTARQQVNVRSGPSFTNSVITTIPTGTQVRVSGSPQPETFNWVWGTVISGTSNGQQGWMNVDAFSQITCPGVGCKNQNEGCSQSSDCCSGPAGLYCDSSRRVCVSSSGQQAVATAAPAGNPAPLPASPPPSGCKNQNEGCSSSSDCCTGPAGLFCDSSRKVCVSSSGQQQVVTAVPAGQP